MCRICIYSYYLYTFVYWYLSCFWYLSCLFYHSFVLFLIPMRACVIEKSDAEHCEYDNDSNNHKDCIVHTRLFFPCIATTKIIVKRMPNTIYIMRRRSITLFQQFNAQREARDGDKRTNTECGK